MQKISLFLILSVMLTIPMAFGQEEALGAQKITLSSDNTAYQEGDVTVSYTHLTLPTICSV